MVHKTCLRLFSESHPAKREISHRHVLAIRGRRRRIFLNPVVLAILVRVRFRRLWDFRVTIPDAAGDPSNPHVGDRSSV